jgi:hypothetical protein
MRKNKPCIQSSSGSRNDFDSSVWYYLIITIREIQLLPLALFMRIGWDLDGKGFSHKADVYEAWHMVMPLIFHTAMATGRKLLFANETSMSRCL